MNDVAHILTARSTFFVLLGFAGIALLFLAPKAAVNVDEQLHYPHAKKVVNWYFTGGNDTSALHTPKSNLKFYGQSVDNITALFNRIFNVKNEFLTRHFTGAILFWLLLLFSGLLAKELAGSYMAAAITVLSLVFMPRLFGQAFGNLKDVPFSTGYVAGLYLIVRFLKELPAPRWITATGLGLAIAFTVSVRAGGFILFAYLGLFAVLFLIWKPFALKQIVSTKPVLVRLLGQGVVIVFIGYFAGLLFWPFALQDVFRNPLASLHVMEHYKISIRQIFEGQLIWSTNLPWYYLPEWLWISTPEFIIFGSLIFGFLFIRDLWRKNVSTRPLFYEVVVAFAFVFPVLYVVAIHSNLYSGVRQLLFILPCLAVLSSVGIYKLVRLQVNKTLKYPAVIFFFVLMLLPLKHQASTFPVDYVYFNSLSGGNKNAWSNYEYDYYFHAIEKPAEYLKTIVGRNEQVTVAMNSNLFVYFDDEPNISYEYVPYLERSSKDWDFGLFGVNYIPPDMLKNNNWQSAETIQTFYHKGNPIAVILKRKDKNDFKGISAAEGGNWEEAKIFLKKAVQNEPDNIWLFVNLAKISLVQNDEVNFNRYIKSGREIYAEYEPFFLLEAQKLYDEKKYEQSYEKMNELLKINPRYKPAEKLLKAVRNKLN